ncbi:MAG: twin-arginine translocase TatA/TatE family subunit [Cyclobacteriaceae bacterium]
METVLLIGMPGPMELFIIAMIVLVFFGAKKIPEIARGMGKGIREFKDATKEVKKEINEGIKDEEKA